MFISNSAHLQLRLVSGGATLGLCEQCLWMAYTVEASATQDDAQLPQEEAITTQLESVSLSRLEGDDMRYLNKQNMPTFT